MGIHEKHSPSDMDSRTNTVEYMLPVGRQIETKNYNLGLEPGTAPKKVGLLANGFPDADNFLRKLSVPLANLWPETEFRVDEKASADQLNIGIQEPLLSELCEECDAIIIAWGHCGSCTGGVTRDAVAFHERGIPCVVIVCDIFWDYFHWMGESMGLKDIPRVKIPFPLSGTGDDNQIKWAGDIAPLVVQELEKHA
jgi:hypothetical protein